MKTFLSFICCFLAIGVLSSYAITLNHPEEKTNSIHATASDQSDSTVSRGGIGKITLHGELKQWHKVTLSMTGPFAKETDKNPNPFTDYRMTVHFQHESGDPEYEVPGYFAASGNASQTGAKKGKTWRAHLSPDKPGTWSYKISFYSGKYAALGDVPWAKPLPPYHGKSGTFTIKPTDKSGRDFRGKGRLEYTGEHHLQFQGSKSYFLKAGADAPETFLAYEDFDSTYTLKAPLKTYKPHISDWNKGDPTWKNGKGKGIIGAVNYLSGKGANAFSFLTYNAAGDGDNVWPFINRNTPLHYDCSKLDQWQIVFDHAQKKGMYLHFKTQEQENDNNTEDEIIEESLDGGDLGPERRLYYRELIARYGYLLALNWNLGEENTQTNKQRRAMARYFAEKDPYNHNIVIHTFPDKQEEVYGPLLGNSSKLTGVSLQNEWNRTHKKTLQWINTSDMTDKPWVVANDEQGHASHGVPPDPGYKDFDTSKIEYDLHSIRKQTLWGNLMAGGAGVEYYFGYELPQNDLECEDYRSRDKTWEYCNIALNFFKEHNIPFWQMENRNELINNSENKKHKYCLAKEEEIYLVYLGYTKTSKIDLSNTEGNYSIQWFNPRKGGKLKTGSVTSAKGGSNVKLGQPPADSQKDWLVIIKKQ